MEIGSVERAPTFESPVRKKFAACVKPQTYQQVSAEQWSDWKWQVSHDRKTPYYASLFSPAKAPSLEISSDSLILKSDDELRETKEFSNEGDWRIIEMKDLPQLPMRVTPEFVTALTSDRQVILNVSFTHPAECTTEAFDACGALADAGIILNNRMPLIADFNDDPETVKKLNHLLLMMRVRPYAIMNASLSIEVGVRIIEKLRGWTSGLAVPHYVVRDAKGLWKAHLPEYVKSHVGDTYTFRNYRHDEYSYRES